MSAAASIDLRDVSAQSLQHLSLTSVAEFVAQFIQCEMDDVMVVHFIRSEFGAEPQPEAVQQIDFLGCQVGSMWTKVEDFFLSIGGKNFEG